MYVNIFACAVPKENRDNYVQHCSTFGEVIKSKGVLRYAECWADEVPDGEMTSFIKAVKCKDDEAVVVGWAEWPDKATADAGMEAAMQDERMANMQMPFDASRLIYGGFENILDVKG